MTILTIEGFEGKATMPECELCSKMVIRNQLKSPYIANW